MAVVAIHEMWTDEINALGGTRDISMRLLVEFEGGRKQWIYYGTDVATTPDISAEQRPAVHFPADFFNLAEDDLLYDLAQQVIIANLNR